MRCCWMTIINAKILAAVQNIKAVECTSNMEKEFKQTFGDKSEVMLVAGSRYWIRHFCLIKLFKGVRSKKG